MIIKISWRLIKILLQRIFITSIVLLFIRSGTFLPVPGINHNDLAFSIQQNLVAKNLIRTFLGDKIFIIGLFTLNIFPAINATIILQLLIGFSIQNWVQGTEVFGDIRPNRCHQLLEFFDRHNSIRENHGYVETVHGRWQVGNMMMLNSFVQEMLSRCNLGLHHAANVSIPNSCCTAWSCSRL